MYRPVRRAARGAGAPARGVHPAAQRPGRADAAHEDPRLELRPRRRHRQRGWRARARLRGPEEDQQVSILNEWCRVIDA